MTRPPFVLAEEPAGLVNVRPRVARDSGRRRHQGRDVEVLPRGTTLQNVIQTSGHGLMIRGGNLPGTTILFRTKFDGLEAVTREHTITDADLGKIIAEEFDSLEITWAVDPRTNGPSDLDDVQIDRPLQLRLWTGIKVVPVAMPETEGQGRIKGLVRGQVTIAAQNLATIWDDDNVTNAIAGEGDRWSFEERSTVFGRLVGWVSTETHTAARDWGVLIAGRFGPGASDFAGVYHLAGHIRTPLHTAGAFEVLHMGSTVSGATKGNDVDDGDSGETGLLLPCPPGGFNIQIYNDEAVTGRTYSYCIGVCTGF